MIIFLGVFFEFSKNSYAQVNGNSVGPELPYGQAGQAVIQAKGYTGVTAVINNITGVPNNYAPGANVILRIDVNAQTTVDMARTFATRLNSSNDFNGGKPTVVVLGVELNNLDPQGWNNKNVSLAQAASDYAKIFNAFSSTIDHAKYKVSPAPPDMYNAVYDPAPWIRSLSANIDCGLVDGLVADVFKVTPAASIGGDWKDTWKYLQANVCGGSKLILHFEGWGSDPKDSIAKQIEFLKTESLPAGVPSATSLIVNNCNSFGGNQTGTREPNKPWLFWIPTTPDKVYNADGSEFDYTTCSAQTVKKPYNLQDVPCNQTIDNEFHNLRPYPASPCNKKVEETALMCSNDLIVKKTFHVTPNDNCKSDGNGTLVCTYAYSGVQDEVSIDLKDAKLPIVGNTEDVPNATTNGSNLDLAQRLNNYVSWYLNGTINMPWEDDLGKLASSEITNRVVNMSGPLRKLLPFEIQAFERVRNAATAVASTIRHNQIVICTGIGGSIVPCREEGLNALGVQVTTTILNRFRISQWLEHAPPFARDFATLSEYVRKYLEWMGYSCVGPNGLYACFLDPIRDRSRDIWGQHFGYVPMSSTEDRVGEVFTDNTVVRNGKNDLEKTTQLEVGKGNGGTVDNISFTPDIESFDKASHHNLYFSHMQEDAELARLLQSTYATKADLNDPNNWESQLQNAIISQNNAPKEETHGCVKQEVRTNPGDSLYGDLDKTKDNGQTDSKISGKLTYDVTFQCEFKPERTVDQLCIQNGGTEATCTKVGYNVCDKDIYASLGIFTKTPKAFELYQRLVGGAMGTFKRFFPKVGQDSVLTEIKDIPGVTTVRYNSDADTRAGLTGKSGAEAELYFPHLGSLEEYFLQGIQKALRPKDTQTTGEVITGQRQCNINADNITRANVHGANYAISDGLIALALKVSKYTCTPAEFIVGVLAGETRGLNYNGSTDSPITGDVNEKVCRTKACVDNQTGALGPFSWSQLGYTNQYNVWGPNARDCLNAIGQISSAPDSRVLGQDMCVTSAKFWGSIHDNGNPTSSCSGDNQRSYSLDEVSADGLKLAYMHFCGNDPRCEGYWEKDLAIINAYKDQVSKVRAQCSNP